MLGRTTEPTGSSWRGVHAGPPKRPFVEAIMSTRPPLLGVTEALPRFVGRLGLRPRPLPEVLVRQLPRIIEPLASLPPLRRIASRLVINHYSYATTLRPRALSMATDYTTWSSLTDRRFTGRHLPPADPETIAALALRERRERAVPPRARDQVDRHQCLVHVLRPVVHRQLPADQPGGLPPEHLDPGDRPVPDLRARPRADPDAALAERRPAEEPADRRRGVPGVPLPGA